MERDKKIIICIVAESGSGKTFVADYIAAKYNIYPIESRTTRPPRHKGESGHMWVTEQEFDTYAQENMIAFTEFGGCRYCCLIEDVTDPIMTYVIDEYGLKYLKRYFSNTFNIFAVRIIADNIKRHKRVDRSRTSRDNGKFTIPLDEFDFCIFNDYDPIKTYKQVDSIINQIITYELSSGNTGVCTCTHGANPKQHSDCKRY